MAVRVNIRHLKDHDVHLQGELSAVELDLDQGDELVHARQPLRYDLTIQEVGDSILAQGSLRLELDCECARCLKPIKQTIDLDHWAAHLPLEGDEKVEIKDDSVDLTPLLREDILLEFPQYPLCGAGCAGLPNRSEQKRKNKGSSPADTSSAWAELNKLKLK